MERAETRSRTRGPVAAILLVALTACAMPDPDDGGPAASPPRPVRAGAPSPSEPMPDVRLHSVLWMQTAAEYANTTRQIYRMAAERLPRALEDPDRSAIPDIEIDPTLPAAVIVDVDETILDNTPHAARSILARRGFDIDAWRRWVSEASAPPVPGAVEYLRTARRLGVQVIYITNRHRDVEATTRRNLSLLGCPIDESPGEDVVLTYRERPEWTGDKTSRRAWVAARYRVLQLVGDDLNDFVVVPPRATIEYRRRLADRHRSRWGDDWFQLPNPLYGSWEQAVTPDGTSIFDAPMSRTFGILETD